MFAFSTLKHLPLFHFPPPSSFFLLFLHLSPHSLSTLWTSPSLQIFTCISHLELIRYKNSFLGIEVCSHVRFQCIFQFRCWAQKLKHLFCDSRVGSGPWVSWRSSPSHGQEPLPCGPWSLSHREMADQVWHFPACTTSSWGSGWEASSSLGVNEVGRSLWRQDSRWFYALSYFSFYFSVCSTVLS